MAKREMVRLGEVCDAVSSNIAQKDLAQNNGDYPIFGASGLIKYVDFFRHDKPYIAIVKDGAGVGRTTPLPAYSSVIGTMQSLVPKEMIYVKYLYYAIHLMNLAKYYTGATIPHIYFKDYKNELLPLPPLPVQWQIADVLDRASALIEKRKAQIDKLDLLIKSQFIEMFGDLKTNNRNWEIHPFTRVATIDTHMTNDFVFYAEYPHIGIESIEKNTGTILDYELVKDSDLKSGKYPFGENHLIYSKIRPNLNKVAKPNFKGLCSADAYPILPTNESNRDYLAIVLRSEYFLDYILAFSGRTNIPKVNKQQLKGFTMPLPPLSLQNEFAVFVKKVETQKKLLQQSLKMLKQNYKSLMQKCFAGEIF